MKTSMLNDTIQTLINKLRGETYMSTLFNVILEYHKILVIASLVLAVLSYIVSFVRQVESLQLALEKSDERVAKMTSANNLLRRTLEILREKNRKSDEKLSEMTEKYQEVVNSVPDTVHRTHHPDDVETGICMAITTLSNTRSVYAKDAVEILRNILGKFEEETPSPQVTKRKRRRSVTPVKFYFSYSSESESEE